MRTRYYKILGYVAFVFIVFASTPWLASLLLAYRLHAKLSLCRDFLLILHAMRKRYVLLLSGPVWESQQGASDNGLPLLVTCWNAICVDMQLNLEFKTWNSIVDAFEPVGAGCFEIKYHLVNVTSRSRASNLFGYGGGLCRPLQQVGTAFPLARVSLLIRDPG